MITLLHIGVIVGCIICAALLFRQPDKLNETSKTFASLTFLAVTFIAAAHVGAFTLTHPSTDSQTLQRLLSNLAIYISLPLLASLMLASSYGYDFSRQSWGRWVLALFALFELMRRMSLGADYSVALGIVSTAALAIAFIHFKDRYITVIGSLSAASWGVAMMIAGPYPVVTSMQSEPLHLITLTIGLVTLGMAAGHIIRKQQTETKKEA